MSQFTKILVATDGSPTSGAAVDRALGFASEPGASVTFLHIVEPTEWRLARGAQAMPMVRRGSLSTATRSSARLSRAPGRQASKPTPRSSRVTRTRSILAVADQIEADVIVLGGGRKRPKLRSVTRAVVNSAHCAVYVARAA